jgi:hypothetical protein
MKKSSLAVAALLTTFSAATIVPVAYADANNAAQIASACKGACAACKGCTGCKGCKGACAGSTCGGCSGS